MLSCASCDPWVKVFFNFFYFENNCRTSFKWTFMFLYSIIATWYALPKHVYRTKIWLTLEESEKNIRTVPEMSLSVRALRSMSACSHTVVSIAPFFLRLLVADASAKIICHWKQRSLGITEPSVRGQHHPLPLCTILPWAARVRRTTLIQFTHKKKGQWKFRLLFHACFRAQEA